MQRSAALGFACGMGLGFALARALQRQQHGRSTSTSGGEAAPTEQTVCLRRVRTAREAAPTEQPVCRRRGRTAHVASVDPSTLSVDLQDVFSRYTTGYGPFTNQASIIAHVPAALRYLPEMLMALKEAKSVPPRYIELAIVVVSRINDCTYCISRHKPKLTVCGVSEDAVDQIMEGAHADFTEADKAVIAWAKKVEADFHRISRSDVAALKLHFTEAQIVEITLRSTLTGFFNRFSEALGIAD